MKQTLWSLKSNHFIKSWLSLPLLMVCLLIVLLSTASSLVYASSGQENKNQSTLTTEDDKQQKSEKEYLYVNGTSHVYKVNAKDGSYVWTSPTLDDNADYEKLPLSGENEVIVRSQSNVITVLEKKTGAIRWQKKPVPDNVPAYISALLTVKQNLLYLVTAQEQDTGYEYKLLVLDVKTGEPRWSFSFPTDYSGSLLLNGVDSLQIVGDRAFLGTSNGDVYAFQRETGKVLWKQSIAIPDGLRITNMTIQPAKGELYIGTTFFNNATGSASGDLMRLHLKNGELVWQQQFSGSIGLMQYDQQAGIVFASVSGFFGPQHLYRVDPQTGKTLWISKDSFSNIRDIVLLKDTVYIRTMVSALLSAISVETGVTSWTWGPDPSGNQKGALSSLVVQQGQIFTHATTQVSMVNALFSLATNGKVRWSYSFGQEGFAMWLDPVVGNTNVYGGNIDNQTMQSNLYAFNQKNGNFLWKITIPEKISHVTVSDK